MSAGLMGGIVASAIGGIIAGVVLKILTETRWVRSLKNLFRWIITALSSIAAVLTISIVVGIVIIPPMEWKVEGKVIDKYGRAPIKDARVTIEKLSAQTGNEGSFLIRYNETVVSKAEIRVEKDGYTPWRDFVPINKFIVIELEPRNPDSDLP